VGIHAESFLNDTLELIIDIHKNLLR